MKSTMPTYLYLHTLSGVTLAVTAMTGARLWAIAICSNSHASNLMVNLNPSMIDINRSVRVGA